MLTSANPQLVLSHSTALLFWRAVREGRLPQPLPLPDTTLPSATITSLRQIPSDLSLLGINLSPQGALALYELTQVRVGNSPRAQSTGKLVPLGLALPEGRPTPLHVLTSHDARRHANPALVAHLLTRTLPTGSFCRVSDQLMVVSPELAFVQSCLPARDLPNIELALELCGSYALATHGLRCRFDCPPLTSVQKLRLYLARLGRHVGTSAARRALEQCTDGMASPRETEVYLLVILPPTAGGYGLPRPLVNYEVRVRGTAAEALASEDHYRVDLAWKLPDGRYVVLEYDGSDEHDMDPEKVLADKERRSVLAAMGYVVIVIAKRDLASAPALRAKMSQVCMALGRELPAFSPEEQAAQEALLAWLGNPHHDHVPFGCGYF